MPYVFILLAARHTFELLSIWLLSANMTNTLDNGLLYCSFLCWVSYCCSFPHLYVFIRCGLRIPCDGHCCVLNSGRYFTVAFSILQHQLFESEIRDYIFDRESAAASTVHTLLCVCVFFIFRFHLVHWEFDSRARLNLFIYSWENTRSSSSIISIGTNRNGELHVAIAESSHCYAINHTFMASCCAKVEEEEEDEKNTRRNINRFVSLSFDTHFVVFVHWK